MARILVIDDAEFVRAVVRSILERDQHEVTEASNGEDGLVLFREQPADLVIVDMRMPVKSGAQVIEELKKDFSDVKIIAISGSQTTFLDTARKLGAHRTFGKPFHVGEFLDAVKKLLGEDS